MVVFIFVFVVVVVVVVVVVRNAIVCIKNSVNERHMWEPGRRRRREEEPVGKDRKRRHRRNRYHTQSRIPQPTLKRKLVKVKPAATKIPSGRRHGNAGRKQDKRNHNSSPWGSEVVSASTHIVCAHLARHVRATHTEYARRYVLR